MDNKDYLERSYSTNYECALQYCKQKNWTGARKSLEKAAEALVKLVQMSYGQEKDRLLTKVKGLTELLQKVKTFEGSVPAPATGASNATVKPAQDKDEKKEDSNKPKPTVEEAIKELYELEGLKGVKDQVSQYVGIVKNIQERKANNLPVPPFSYHLIFTGNPGTGKTTVARIMAKIFCALGICEKSEIVEVVASDLVGQYVGHTANKTKEVIGKAKGGVLFLDEAYRLVEEGTRNFGQEAIGEILTEMENNRDSLIVIAAGYEDDMKEFIKANDGLPSRFKTTLEFADYNGEEMFRIFKNMCNKYQYTLTPQAEEIMKQKLNDLYVNRTEIFANARDVRNKFELIYANQANRMATTPHTAEDLRIFDVQDLQGV
ncbi:MAG: AAA family ATPase [Clostridia bacterium]|nr:AAA family ATPase [Clostridia bacterium]